MRRAPGLTSLICSTTTTTTRTRMVMAMRMQVVVLLGVLLSVAMMAMMMAMPTHALFTSRWHARHSQQQQQQHAPVASAPAAASVPSAGPVTSIVSGTNWLDTDGNSIQAHATGIMVDPTNPGAYWWYGESLKTSSATTHGVNCYYSTDLYNWKFMGSSINQSDLVVPGTPGPYTIERPKVLYNQATQQYVMWFHIDNSNYSIRRVGVAVAFSPGDKFQFVRSFQPDNLPSLDMNLYEDRINGVVQGAYFVRSVDNSYVGISKLTPDYLDSAGLVSIIPEPREGHAIFHYGNAYYMMTSHLTGWAPNAAELFMSNKDTLIGAEWTSLGNPTGSSTTYDSQSTFVLPFPSTKNPGQDFFIYMGDRWDSPNLLNASYIWLPITITSPTDMSIAWLDQWQLSDY